jgi:hypothetical protein
MTSTLERDLIDYLRLEASGVDVNDTLDDIERGVTVVAFAPPYERPRRTLPFIGAAASIILVAGLVIARQDRIPEQAAGSVTPSTTPSEDDTVASTNETTVPPTTAAPTTTPAQVPLPAGGRIQGIAPSCTTTDSIVYDCTIPEYPADGRALDMTGFTTIIVDDTSHVSGGCRATSEEATRFTCFIGQRAIDEQIVGPDYLGDWAPQGYIAG